MARIIDHSQEIINATNEAIYNALYIIGAKAADYAAGLAPVDTGRLKNSLTHEVAMDEKAVYVGTNVEYAPYVEFGTYKQRPQPYLKPAIQNHMDEYKNILETELKM
jgi:HK97 gp10 family phage protein